MKQVYGLLAFDETHQALKAERIAKKQQLEVRLIPTPEKIIAGCGLSLRFSLDDLTAIQAIQIEQVRAHGLYQLVRENQHTAITPL